MYIAVDYQPEYSSPPGPLGSAPRAATSPKSALFALCSFYLPHPDRDMWQYGPTADVWSALQFPAPLDFGRARTGMFAGYEDAELMRRTHYGSYLVPIDRLAGKFCPGVGLKRLEPDVAKSLFKGADGRENDGVMAVLRLHTRSVPK
jgi:hypothetical protein